jgi:hypothetical protein
MDASLEAALRQLWRDCGGWHRFAALPRAEQDQKPLRLKRLRRVGGVRSTTQAKSTVG